MVLVRFSKDHEYIRVEGDIGTVGITKHAAEQLGDVVHVEFPDIGRQVKQGEIAAIVESVKAAGDVFAPVSGEVIEVNGDLPASPALVNEDAEGKAWIFKIRMTNKADLDTLMDAAAYRAFIAANT